MSVCISPALIARSGQKRLMGKIASGNMQWHPIDIEDLQEYSAIGAHIQNVWAARIFPDHVYAFGGEIVSEGRPGSAEVSGAIQVGCGVVRPDSGHRQVDSTEIIF